MTDELDKKFKDKIPSISIRKRTNDLSVTKRVFNVAKFVAIANELEKLDRERNESVLREPKANCTA